MASALELSKLVIATLLHTYWKEMNRLLAGYLTVALFVLVVITSAGIYGFLSDAYQQTANKDRIVSKKIEILKYKKGVYAVQLETLKGEKTTLYTGIGELRKSLGTSNQSQYIDRKTGQLITNVSSGNKKAVERQLAEATSRQEALDKEIQAKTDSVLALETRILETEASSDVAAELGPLKYVSGLTGIEMDRVVNYFLLLLIFVFDPLAITLVLAANFAFELKRRKETEAPDTTLPSPAPQGPAPGSDEGNEQVEESQIQSDTEISPLLEVVAENVPFNPAPPVAEHPHLTEAELQELNEQYPPRPMAVIEHHYTFPTGSGSTTTQVEKPKNVFLAPGVFVTEWDINYTTPKTPEDVQQLADFIADLRRISLSRTAPSGSADLATPVGSFVPQLPPSVAAPETPQERVEALDELAPALDENVAPEAIYKAVDPFSQPVDAYRFWKSLIPQLVIPTGSAVQPLVAAGVAKYELEDLLGSVFSQPVEVVYIPSSGSLENGGDAPVYIPDVKIEPASVTLEELLQQPVYQPYLPLQMTKLPVYDEYEVVEVPVVRDDEVVVEVVEEPKPKKRGRPSKRTITEHLPNDAASKHLKDALPPEDDEKKK
jgi:hypothetical protein